MGTLAAMNLLIFALVVLQTEDSRRSADYNLLLFCHIHWDIFVPVTSLVDLGSFWKNLFVKKERRWDKKKTPPCISNAFICTASPMNPFFLPQNPHGNWIHSAPTGTPFCTGDSDYDSVRVSHSSRALLPFLSFNFPKKKKKSFE